MKKKNLLLSVLLAGAAISLASCGGQKKPSASTPAPVQSTPAPTKETTPKTTPKTTTPAPTPSSTTPAPTPSSTTPAPTPSSSTPAPTPSSSTPAPAPVVEKITVTFDVADEEVEAIDAVEINKGAKVTAPEDPERTGYTFDGWYNGDAAFNFDTELTANTTLTAHWTIKTFAVTFDTNGGSEVASQTVNYNEKVTAPAAPTKEGKNFIGWYDQDDAAFDFDNIKIKKNTTIVAQYEDKVAKYEAIATSADVVLAENFNVRGPLATSTDEAFGKDGVTPGFYVFKKGSAVTDASIVDVASNKATIKDEGDNVEVHLKADLGAIKNSTITGYFEFSLNEVVKSYTPVAFMTTGTTTAPFDLRIKEVTVGSEKKNQLVYRLGGTEKTNVETAIYVDADTTYKVEYVIDQNAGTITVTINEQAFVTNLSVDFTVFSGVKFGSRTSGTTAPIVDNFAVKAVTVSLTDKITTVKTQLEAYYNRLEIATKYTTNGADVTTAYNAGVTAIEAATTVSEVDTAYENAVEAIKAIKSDATIALETAQTEKTALVEAFNTTEQYTTATADQKTSYDEAIAAAKTAIAAAKTAAEVNEKYQEFEETCNDIKAVKVTITYKYVTADGSAVSELEDTVNEKQIKDEDYVLPTPKGYDVLGYYTAYTNAEAADNAQLAAEAKATENGTIIVVVEKIQKKLFNFGDATVASIKKKNATANPPADGIVLDNDYLTAVTILKDVNLTNFTTKVEGEIQFTKGYADSGSGGQWTITAKQAMTLTIYYSGTNSAGAVKTAQLKTQVNNDTAVDHDVTEAKAEVAYTVTIELKKDDVLTLTSVDPNRMLILGFEVVLK